MGRVYDPAPRDLEMASGLSVGPLVNLLRIRTLSPITKMKYKWTRRWRRKVLGAAEEGAAAVVVVEGVDVAAVARVEVAEDAAAAAAVVAAAAAALRAEWVRRKKGSILPCLLYFSFFLRAFGFCFSVCSLFISFASFRLFRLHYF